MVITDPMAFLNEQITKGQEKGSGTFKPTFFMLKNGEKALIRPLANLNAYVGASVHEKYDQGTKKYTKGVCAAEYSMECLLCQQAQTDKKLAASVRFILPIYVYKIVRKKTDDKGKVILDKGSPVWETVTYKNAEDEEVPISGLRLLEMKRTSSILLDLNSLYGEEGDITKADIAIERKGEGLDTKYTTTNKAPKPFEVKIDEDLSRDGIMNWLADAIPFQIVDGSPALPASASAKAGAAAGGKTIDDDF